MVKDKDSKVLWNTTREILNKDVKTEMDQITLKDYSGNKVNNDVEIANEFNNFLH